MRLVYLHIPCTDANQRDLFRYGYKILAVRIDLEGIMCCHGVLSEMNYYAVKVKNEVYLSIVSRAVQS